MVTLTGDSLLARALPAIARDVDSMFDALLPGEGRLAEAMRYATIGGGKRLRPLLLTATAALHGADRTQALRAAIALESIHAYSLVHDDLPCMDDDAMRHGKPSTHKAFGEAMAVLVGDALHAFAFEVLADPATSGDPFVRSELVQILATASGPAGMVGGQVLDIEGEGQALDLPAITRMQQQKTGALLSASVEMGAVLGRLPPEGRTHLKGYARDIGLAFQIADDLLDHAGDEAKAGKALRKDAGAGKQTFVALLGEERARGQARMLVDQALAHLTSYGQEADLLRSIARYIVERDR
ncbi:farnesyl diphosphate synthase [Novosphingobium kunmingense]|uniref:Farnesyl diphosphate synthase n=1 Tax=Novosphingobium kunmingense TaxID=1211806 RepID=A0A2N0I220_9SPHN|nr:farnesyl diphosphate synthase [Novosphingobium kunmingense]PKB25227.1 farnesyl diphosphate synthase [Novosphingobium kunmingense]